MLFAGGWSLLLLALFYWVIDVQGYRKWAFFFVVIGINAITIYFLVDIIDFKDRRSSSWAGSHATSAFTDPWSCRWAPSWRAGCSCGSSTVTGSSSRSDLRLEFRL